MRVVFASLPAYGHLYPLMPLAQAFAAVGHQVVLAVGDPFHGRMPLPTVSAMPAERDLGWSFAETRRRHPGIAGQDMVVAMFAEIAAESTVDALVPEYEKVRPDLVVYEALDVGAGVAADVLGISVAAFGIGMFEPAVPLVHMAAARAQAGRWADHGRPVRAETSLLAGAYLDPIPAGLHPGGVPSIPHRLPIRPQAWSESIGGVPGWLTAARVRPRVYITLGTVSYGAVEVLRRAVRETATLGVDVLVTVGPHGDPSALGEVPDAVHVERFVPQSLVLPLVDVVVHHGGTGTMLGALEAGLPQLVLPQGADQFHNGGVVAQAGAGRMLRNEEQLAGEIQAAVAALLADGPERATARRLSQEIAALPAPAVLVDALVQFADG